MEDIEFKTTNKKFKCRVNGLIIHDGKILTLRMKNNTSYCLPGSLLFEHCISVLSLIVTWFVLILLIYC